MTPLPLTFQSRGFAFRQIDRQGDVATFEKRWHGTGIPSYEVVIVQKRKACVIHGHTVPAHKAMPSSEQWGWAGFTLTTRASAFSRVASLPGYG